MWMIPYCRNYRAKRELAHKYAPLKIMDRISADGPESSDDEVDLPPVPTSLPMTTKPVPKLDETTEDDTDLR